MIRAKWALPTLIALAACSSEGGNAGPADTADPLQAEIDTIVLIYAENHSFDSLFGNFPGAHDLSEVIDAQGASTAEYVPQKDRDGTTVLPKLPKTWSGVAAAGNPKVVPEHMTDDLPNQPFSIERAFVADDGSTLTTADVTRDLAHRFFEHIMEINGGTNDMFGAWVDAGGLTMGHFDHENSRIFELAQQYVLADNFFQGAFGGSFLNHQYLICACAPSLPGLVRRPQLAFVQRPWPEQRQGRAAARSSSQLACFGLGRCPAVRDRQRCATRLLRRRRRLSSGQPTARPLSTQRQPAGRGRARLALRRCRRRHHRARANPGHRG